MTSIYSVKIFYPGESTPRETHALDSSPSVLELISSIAKSNAGCERIEIYGSGVLLFAVDCSGNRLSG